MKRPRGLIEVRRSIVTLAVGLAGVGTLAACSPDSTDFKSEGEDFLEDTGSDVETQTGHTFSDADCEKPADTDTGTIYTCTATDDEGDVWEFTIEITGERELTVQGGYASKLAVQAIVDSLSSLGSVDEACVQSVVDGYDPEEIKAAYLGADPDSSQALFDELRLAAEAQCVS